MLKFKEVPVDKLLNALRYEPETGKFYRKTCHVKANVGRELRGRPAWNGYIRIGIFNEDFFAHRLAWLCVYGVWPNERIDHINRDRADNRIANLRLANPREHRGNAKMDSRNKTGYRGVFKYPHGYTAQICNNYLGTFETAELAAAAYRAASEKYFGSGWVP